MAVEQTKRTVQHVITEELESRGCRDQVFNRPQRLIPEIISLIISSHRLRSVNLGITLIPSIIIIIVAVGFIFRWKYKHVSVPCTSRRDCPTISDIVAGLITLD